jgi:hypothetical protein
MARKTDMTDVLSFVRIMEAYPDDYILVRIAEIDHDKGTQTGTAIYTSASRKDLVSLTKREGIGNGTIILQGENLAPMIGGLL